MAYWSNKHGSWAMNNAYEDSVEIPDPPGDSYWFDSDSWAWKQHEAAIAVHICSPWQIRKALNRLGLRQAVEDAVAVSTDQDLKDGWEKASEFRSDDPFVIAMGAFLGKSASETGELIAFAATL